MSKRKYTSKQLKQRNAINIKNLHDRAYDAAKLDLNNRYELIMQAVKNIQSTN